MENKEISMIEYINNLKGYQGYVQFSHRAIDLKKDIFPRKDDIKDEKGFIYEAHFYNGIDSITIKQVNDSCLISKTYIPNIKDEDRQTYISEVEGCSNIIMAQIWEATPDELCEGMEVMKLKKVVFAGFEKTS